MKSRTYYKGKDKLVVGNDFTLNIKHIGSTNLCHYSKPLKLKNILHVPKITKNLISISQFSIDNNVLVEFSSVGFTIKDNDTKNNLLQGTLKEGLYHLDCSTLKSTHGSSHFSYHFQPILYLSSLVDNSNKVLSSLHNSFCQDDFVSNKSQYLSEKNKCNSQIASSVNNYVNEFCKDVKRCNQVFGPVLSFDDNVKLWHLRLGHPSSCIMNKVLNCLQIPNSSYNHSFFCEACQFGKLHQTIFPASFSQTTRPFELVHTDV